MTTEIVEYSKTEAALADLTARYKGVLYDVTTREGMKDAVAGRAELRDLRVALEKTRKEIKEPALRRSQQIDSEARRITAALESLENPIDEQIKSETKKKEREEAERLRLEAEKVAAEEKARKDAEEAKMATERAELAKQRAELDKANQERLAAEAASRAKIEREETAARMVREEADRASRLKIEHEERIARQAREVEEANLKAERDKAEAERREIERQKNELLDARTMLETFKKRFGHLPQFAGVIKAITEIK